MPIEILNLNDLRTDPDELQVISIQAPGIPPHKLAYFINKTLSWNLTHTRRIFSPRENPECEIEVFSHIEEIDRTQWILLSNRSERHFWIQKRKDIDFWLMLTGPGMEFKDLNRESDLLSDVPVIFSAARFPISDPVTKRKSPYFKFFEFLYDELSMNEILYRFE